jgi:CBS domain-containing protein
LQIPAFEKTYKEAINMHVGEVMTRNVEVIGSNASLKEAAAKMKSLDVGLIPVCEADELKGTLTDRDITVRGIAEGHNPLEKTVGDIMSTDLAYCFEDEDIDQALALMEERQIRRLPVLSREKRLVGIVSLGDLAVHAGQRERLGETLKEVSQPAAPRR